MSFTCSYCENTFSSKSNLITHQKRTKYCLDLQGKDTNVFACSCGKKYTLSKNLYRHQEICDIHRAMEEGPSQAARILQIMLDKYQETIKTLQKKPADRTTIMRNAKLDDMEPITDELLERYADQLTISYINQGAQGYANFAKVYPLKDNAVFTDKSRKKIKYKNEHGEISEDSQVLAQRFFRAISKQNAKITKEICADLLKQMNVLIDEGRGGVANTCEFIRKCTNLQDIDLQITNVVKGENEEFIQEFISHLAKIL